MPTPSPGGTSSAPDESLDDAKSLTSASPSCWPRTPSQLSQGQVCFNPHYKIISKLFQILFCCSNTIFIGTFCLHVFVVQSWRIDLIFAANSGTWCKARYTRGCWDESKGNVRLRAPCKWYIYNIETENEIVQEGAIRTFLCPLKNGFIRLMTKFNFGRPLEFRIFIDYVQLPPSRRSLFPL